jgi:hypothetical protein
MTAVPTPGPGRFGADRFGPGRFLSAATTFPAFYQIACRIPGIPDTEIVITDSKPS